MYPSWREGTSRNSAGMSTPTASKSAKPHRNETVRPIAPKSRPPHGPPPPSLAISRPPAPPPSSTSTGFPILSASDLLAHTNAPQVLFLTTTAVPRSSASELNRRRCRCRCLGPSLQLQLPLPAPAGATDQQLSLVMAAPRRFGLGYPQLLPLNFPPISLFPSIFSSPAAVPPKYSPYTCTTIIKYHFLHQLSIFYLLTITRGPTSQCLWMNSDTLY
jgi:hypothetical protein